MSSATDGRRLTVMSIALGLLTKDSEIYLLKIGETDIGVKATGKDGKDGIDGITPQLRINTEKHM